MSGGSGDAGFGLVELLVALAICSFLVLGIGGLLTFAGQLRDRTEGTAVVQHTLLELTAVASGLSQRARMEVTEIGANGFALRVAPDEPVAIVALRERDLDVQYNGTSNSISVDLSGFDAAALEYLEISDHAANWRATWDVPVSPGAVRLHLAKGRWRWPLILWIAERRGAP